MKIRIAFFKSAMVAMANKHDFDLLLKNFPIIFDVDSEDEDALITIGHYVLGMLNDYQLKFRKK